MTSDLTLRGALRGLVLLASIWWTWGSYSWLGNHSKADAGVVRGGMIAGIAAMFVAGLAIPRAWARDGGGLSAALVLAGALAFVQISHIAVYFLAAKGDSKVQGQILRMGAAVCVSSTLLVVGAFMGGPAQTVLWFAGLFANYAGVYFGGTNWRPPMAAHFAERHGLIVIVALGESFVAVGLGASQAPITSSVIIAALLGMLISLSLWWTYFDVTAVFAERVLAAAEGLERIRLARDSYTYLHFPMIVGIIYLAVGLKKVMSYVATHSSHELTGVPLYALFGGVSLYLLAIVAFRYRNVHSLSVPRVVAAFICLALILIAAQLPALAALSMTAAVLVCLIAFEAIHYAGARTRIRYS